VMNILSSTEVLPQREKDGQCTCYAKPELN
jgi:hypothetical protein